VIVNIIIVTFISAFSQRNKVDEVLFFNDEREKKKERKEKENKKVLNSYIYICVYIYKIFIFFNNL